jgi:hypothetical protein
MIVDSLTVAGILAGTLYLVAFAWFGKETLKVDEPSEDRNDRATGATEIPCTDS